jgi:hypothetical protein
LDYLDFGRIISLDFPKSADNRLPQNRSLAGLPGREIHFCCFGK